MKSLSKVTLLFLSLFLSSNLSAIPDQFVKLGGKITISKESDQWVKASVPFTFVNHPLAEKFKSRKPTSKEEVINLEYIDNIKINSINKLINIINNFLIILLKKLQNCVHILL